ncbi:hypothetical protein GCM10010389_33780 [Streptomyces echinoruber]|uniref:Uncharacterized protein n=1 Tax=Streptomyces echinoruber TaxID=68898 RepID=A0A918RBH3_9ACTN|nr:hypothetical protein GCM10010389_33780 [Streptomyces echinoruber]
MSGICSRCSSPDPASHHGAEALSAASKAGPIKRSAPLKDAQTHLAPASHATDPCRTNHLKIKYSTKTPWPPSQKIIESELLSCLFEGVADVAGVEVAADDAGLVLAAVEEPAGLVGEVVG